MIMAIQQQAPDQGYSFITTCHSGARPKPRMPENNVGGMNYNSNLYIPSRPMQILNIYWLLLHSVYKQILTQRSMILRRILVSSSRLWKQIFYILFISYVLKRKPSVWQHLRSQLLLSFLAPRDKQNANMSRSMARCNQLVSVQGPQWECSFSLHQT